MDVQRALEILYDNEESENASFLDYLHERSQFNVASFWEYHDSLLTLSKYKNMVENVEVLDKVIHTYTYALCCFIFHFDSDDAYVMKDLPTDYIKYINLLNDAFRRYVNSEATKETFEQ